ncbi:hypothetical protein DVH05_025357 [Phytophthora capsici]|nr:hypothetical protein DVH05_025357 [Phytophthora capsici]
MLVADHNDIPPTTARQTVATGRDELRPRGGARRASTKCTPAIEQALEEYLEDNCSYTLNATRDMVRFDFGVELSTSTISIKLIGKLYTTKQVVTVAIHLSLSC